MSGGPESKDTPGGPAIPLNGYSGTNTPYFKLFQCQNLTIHKMDYCEVVKQLIKILLLIVNKTDTLVMTWEMIEKYLEVDELIQQIIVREITADIGKVA